MGPESPQNPKPDDLPEDERTGHEPDPSRPEAYLLRPRDGSESLD